MNFDRLAPFYPWLETFCAGSLMQRCRTAFLARVKHCRRALLIGEGTGKFLTELLRAHPEIEITCVEQSRNMIEQSRRRLAREQLEVARVQFVQADILNWTLPPEKFDLIVTNFFLDCFGTGQLQTLVPQLAGSATPDAVWLLADFCVPENGWRRWRAKMVLASLYTFFKMTTSLAANRLTPPDGLLVSAGFDLRERRLASFGLTHADYWQRNIS